MDEEFDYTKPIEEPIPMPFKFAPDFKSQAPIGTWAERWIPFVCKHKFIRCTHGDEIGRRKGHRRVCLVCGIALKGPLPRMCFFTGELHHSCVSGFVCQWFSCVSG